MEAWGKVSDMQRLGEGRTENRRFSPCGPLPGDSQRRVLQGLGGLSSSVHP